MQILLTGKKEGIRAPRPKRKISTRQKIGIALVGGLVVTGLSVGQANAFSITSIIGNISQILGVDIAPMLDKIAYIEGLAKAITSGNWGQAAQILTQAIGSYGTVDPEKLQQAVYQAANDRYVTTGAQSDFGAGLQGAIAEEELQTGEIQRNVQQQINSGEDAQQSWIEKGEGLTESVKQIADFSAQAGQATNSLKVLRIISAQTAGHASISGQQLSETRGIHRSLLEMQNALNTIASQGSRDERMKLKQKNSASAMNITQAGLFAGAIVPGSGGTQPTQTGTQSSQNPLFGSSQQQPGTTLGVPSAWTPQLPSNNQPVGQASTSPAPLQPLWGQSSQSLWGSP